MVSFFLLEHICSMLALIEIGWFPWWKDQCDSEWDDDPKVSGVATSRLGEALAALLNAGAEDL
jgi:hypothetical protein